VLGALVFLGDSGSGERAVSGRGLSGEPGRSDEPGGSRSFDLALPKPPKAEPMFEVDFCSDEA
jgi:hypothetical protein